MPWPLLRVIEGLLAIVFAAGVLLVVFGFSATVADGQPVDRFRMYGFVMGPGGAAAVVGVFLVAAVWFGFNAIRGGSTPTNGSERDSARKG